MVDFLQGDFTVVPDEKDKKPEPSQGIDFLSGDWRIAGQEDQDEEEYGFDTGRTFKKDDLKNDEELSNRLRKYMVSRSGVRYSDPTIVGNDKLVEDFVEHMRNFNTNIVSTAGEVRFISNASDEDKLAARDAYQIYDQLGNVFVNDGFYGAVDGIWDYVSAAATDPSNYIGLLTGGAAKAGAFGGGVAAKQLVKRAAAEAGRKALKNGATRAAAEKAGQEAAEAAIARFTAAKVNTAASREAIKRAGDLEKNIFLSQAKRAASREVLDKAAQQRGRRALMATTAADALIAMGQDYEIQSLMLDVGAQEEYSALQTGFSSLFGAVGGGLQLTFGKAAGSSGLGGVTDTLGATAKRAEVQEEVGAIIAKETALSKSVLDDDAMKKAAADIKKGVRDWKAKWQSGRAIYKNQTTEADLLNVIVLGADGKGKTGGLVKAFRDSGAKLPKNARVSDVITNVVKYMPQRELEEINSMLSGTGLSLGEMSQVRINLQNLVANEANRAGSVLSVFSRAKNMLDVNIIKASDALEGATQEIVEREAKEAGRLKGVQYGQNLWRRMLVSSPATTAVNVAGFSQYYIGSTLADILTGTGVTLAGLASTGAKRAEYLRVGKVYRSMVAQKMRYLLDPYTTHDTYMKFLSQNEDVSKVLFETVTGGVERTAKRFGIDPDNQWYVVSEKVANGVNKWTGVRVQDSFTKSQMFMSEMDKYLRINKGKTLQEVLNGGDTKLIDDDVLGAALDGTMKSVFSKDYTTDDQLLGQAAKLVEEVSNTPLLGTLLPFGRFMNNVIATGYQWSVGGAVEVMSAIAKADKRNLSTVEAASRTLVAWSGAILAMQYDEERRKQGLGITEVELGGGQIADMKNMYPLSAFLVAGRYLNNVRNGEPITQELMTAVGEQFGVGQLVSDVQFGNDLKALLTVFSPESDEDAARAGLNAMYKQGGNILAGFTRPLDAVNRAVGYINDSDIAKDPRQAEGVNILSQSALKYVDNIIEVFVQDLDAVTGEELRVASRVGPLQDANPAARIAGITVKPPQNATEFVYNMSEMMTYTANMRSNNPAYDKIYNTMLAPLLEEVATDLMKTPGFMKGDLNARRNMLKQRLSQVKADLTKYLDSPMAGEKHIEQLRKKALSKGSKEARSAAKRHLEKRGSKAAVSDMNYTEITEFLAYIDYYNEMYGKR